MCSALGSTLGATVVTYEEYRRERRYRDLDFKALSVTDIFLLTHRYGGLGGESTLHDSASKYSVDSKIFVSVKAAKGNNVVIETSVEETVAAFKRKVQSKLGIPANEQRLTFNGKKLEDGKMLSFYSIEDDCVVYVTQVSKSGSAPMFYIDDSMLDSKYHYDLTNTSDDGTKYYRGGKLYYRPYGWMRYGLKVLGKYDNGDNTWLGEDGIRTKSSAGEWPVSYHGTGIHEGCSIAQGGYDLSKGVRFKYGKGIYCSPCIDVAAKYAQTVDHKGKKYQLVLQNRVSSRSLKEVNDAQQGIIWVQPHDHLIRPYGICLKPLANRNQSTSAQTRARNNDCVLL